MSTADGRPGCGGMRPTAGRALEPRSRSNVRGFLAGPQSLNTPNPMPCTLRTVRGVRRMRTATIGAATAAILLAMVPVATATHGTDSLDQRRTYEVPPVWNDLALMSSTNLGDPTGTTEDGSLDGGGVIFARDALPAAHRGDVRSVDVSIVDDQWGPEVVMGTICVEIDGDDLCGEGFEPWQWFCGSLEGFDVPAGWVEVQVYLAGPGAQFLWDECPFEPAPTGATTGGVRTDDGGVFATFGLAS